MLDLAITILVTLSELQTGYLYIHPDQMPLLRLSETYRITSQTDCGQKVRKMRPSSKRTSTEADNYYIIFNINEKWDKRSFPIPLMLTVCNSSSERAIVSFPEPIITTTMGQNVLPSEESMFITDSAGKKSIKVREFNLRRPSVEPSASFSYEAMVGEEYELKPLVEYELKLRQWLYLPDSLKEVAIVSAPIKLVLKPAKK